MMANGGNTTDDATDTIYQTFDQLLAFVNFSVGFVAVTLNMFVIYTLGF
jgi:hypothetical protein